jgi:hypothetical protein
LDLSERVSRLVIRLEYGVRAEAVELVRFAGRDLARGDYRRLTIGGLTNHASIDRAEDGIILAQVGLSAEKLRLIREYAERARLKSSAQLAPVPELRPYQA